MTIELPNRESREYLRAFGVAAIYVAAGPSRRPCLVGATRNLYQTREQIRKSSLDMVSIFWLRERKLADRLIKDLESCMATINGRIDAGADQVAALIASIAARRKITLTPHDHTLERVDTASRHVDRVMVSANARGDLQWFNQAYRRYRIEHPNATVTYGQARNRLRYAMVERIAGGAAMVTRLDLLGELFGRR